MIFYRYLYQINNQKKKKSNSRRKSEVVKVQRKQWCLDKDLAGSCFALSKSEEA